MERRGIILLYGVESEKTRSRETLASLIDRLADAAHPIHNPPESLALGNRPGLGLPFCIPNYSVKARSATSKFQFDINLPV